MTSASVGISFGSESVVVAVTNTGGNPQVYANADGDRTTPAYVAFIDGEVLHGNAARAAYVRQPVQTVPYLLPLLSADVVNAGSLQPKCDVEVSTDAATGEERVVFPTVDTDGVLPTALPRTATDADDKTNPHLATEIFTSFLGNVKAKGIDGPVNGRPVTCVCATIPRYMDQAVVRKALENANLGNDIRVIYDDVAAVIANQIGNVGGANVGSKAKMLTERNDILVIDWGANVLAASLLRLEGGSFRVLGHTHKFGCGGAAADKQLAKNCCETFKKKTQIDASENGRSMRKLLLALEGTRKTLSTSVMCSIDVEAFNEGMDFKDSLSRVKLDMAIRAAGLLDSLNDTLKTVVDMVDPCEHVDVKHVVLSGGFCLTPCIQTNIRFAVQELIPGGETAQIYDSVPSDEAAALGACTEAVLSTASYAALTQPAPEVDANKYRPLNAAIKDVDAVDMLALDAGIAIYTGAAPFSTTATTVTPAKVQEVLEAYLGPRVASPTGANQADFTKAAAAQGAYEIPNEALYTIAARGAAMPVSSPLVAAAIGAAVLPLAVIAANATHSYVLPLFKKPYKLNANPNFKVLVAPDDIHGSTVVSVLEENVDGIVELVESAKW